MEEIFNELVDSFVPFVVLTFGLVEFFKTQLGLEGKAATWLSFGIGVLIGGAFFAVRMFPEIGVYVMGAIFILATGLVASGFYDFGNKRLPEK